MCSVHFEGGKKKDQMICPPYLHGHNLLEQHLCQENALIDWKILAWNVSKVIWWLIMVIQCILVIWQLLETETVSTNTDLLGEDVGTQTPRSVFDDVQTQTIRNVSHVGV